MKCVKPRGPARREATVHLNSASSRVIAGLSGSADDIRHRKEVFGANVIPPRPPKSFLQLAWEAMQDITLIILIIAAVISFALSIYQPTSDEEEGQSL